MPEVRIVAKNFMDMVAALPAMKLDKLYSSTFICEAVLRSLPPLAKKYVLQMLFIDSPVTAKSMEEWLLADGYSKHKVSIDRLLQLRVERANALKCYCEIANDGGFRGLRSRTMGVLLVATYKLSSSRKINKLQFIYEESFPTVHSSLTASPFASGSANE